MRVRGVNAGEQLVGGRVHRWAAVHDEHAELLVQALRAGTFATATTAQAGVIPGSPSPPRRGAPLGDLLVHVGDVERDTSPTASNRSTAASGSSV